ncbi:MAG TPA: septum formation initiator family protein [Candidatus Paceibacterota bacterium]|nr:septum formation initiator family protein [Candidatus Paceibacterota bacterium]
MTHRNPHKQPGAAAAALNVRVMAVNAALLIAAAFLLAYYVVQANRLSAMQYGIREAQRDLASVREAHDAVDARVAQQEDPERIEEYARSRGMVQASDASYVAVQEHVAGMTGQ